MNERLRRALPDLLIATLLLAIPLIVFFPQTLGGRTMLPADVLYRWQPYRALADEVGVRQPHNTLIADLVLENLAWKQFARQQLAAGDIPLWQPNILAGSPFLAAGQSSMLYPFSLLFLILPPATAFGWFAVLQLWIAGLNAYVLGRVLGLRRPAALIAALTYQLSGFMIIGNVFPMIVATAAWLPLELAMLELAIRQQPIGGQPATLPWAVIGALGLGMAALAGHVEALYFTLIVMGFYAVWRLIAEGRRGRHEKPLRWLALRAVWLAAMVLAGLALSAVQIVPAYELASRSFREGAVPLEQVRAWAYPARHVLAFLMPNFYGNPAHHAVFDLFSWRWTPVTTNALGEPIHSTAWGIKNYVEGAAYVGILPLLLAGIAAGQWVVSHLGKVGTRRAVSLQVGKEEAGRPYRAIFGVLGLLALSFAFGAPTYALLYYGLPFINQSHAPFRWVWPFTLCVAVLAGFGVEALTPAAARSPLSRQERGAGGEGIAVAGILVIAGVVASRIFYAPIEGLMQRLFEGLALATSAFPDVRTFYSYEALNTLIFGFLLLASGVVIALARRTSSPSRSFLSKLERRGGGMKSWHVLAALLVAADLILAAWGFFPAADPALLEVVPPSIAWLKEHYDPLNPWRLAVYEQPGADTLNANIAWLHGLEDISGYDSLIPAQYADYMGVIMPQTDLPYNRIAPLYATHPDALDSPLLDLLGVRYVISETPIQNPRYALAYEDEAVYIYENPAALPRAFTLPYASTLAAADFTEAARRYDVRHHVLVETLPVASPPPDGTPAEPRPAAITVNSAQEMWVDVDAAEERWLVITASYFPGWRAWIRPLGAADNEEWEVPVYLVDGNFCGVYLPEGRWTVRMKFSPDSFRFGAFASLLAGAGMLFAVGVWAWRYLYRESGEGAEIRRVAKNTLTPIVLNLFNKGISFVLTFAMLRVLGPAGAGDYRYAVVIYGWFEILANFGLNTFLTREVARHKDEANRYLANTTILRLALVVLGVPLLAGFILIRQTFISPPQSTATLITLGLLYCGLFFSTISTGLTALFYAYEKAEYPAAIQTVSAFLTTALGITALLAGGGIIGLAAVSLIVNVVTFAILGALAVRMFFRPRWSFDWALQKLALVESFPLMINHLLATLFFRVAVVLLEALKGSVVVGWYSVVYTWVDAIMVIPAYFTLSLFPVMSRQAVEDRRALRRTYLLAVKLMSLIAVPTAIFTALLAPFLVNVLGGPQYLPHGAVALAIFIWSILIGWINSVTQYVIIALNRQRTLTIAFAVVTVFAVAANLIAIPRYSYAAAAVVAILSEGVLWGLFTLVIVSELGRINWAGVLGRIWAAGIFTGGTAFGLAQVNMWLGFAAGVVIYAAALLLLRPFSADELRQLTPVLPAPLRRVTGAG